MASLRSVNDYVARIGNGYFTEAHFSVEVDAATSSTVHSGQLFPIQKTPLVYKAPSLPSGVTGYRITNTSIHSSSQTTFMLARLFDMGSLDISTPSFTDGSAFPTVTEGNASNATYGICLMEVTTALSGTPGSFTVTYVDQDGNSSETTASTAFAASSAARTCAWVPLNAGDVGVRDITSATRTGGTTPTGVIKFWGVEPLSMFAVVTAGQYANRNHLMMNIAPPLLAANDELYILVFGSTSARNVHGTLFIVGDQA